MCIRDRSLYVEMSPTATLPEGPWTKSRPTTEKFGRVTVVLTSVAVTSPGAASTPAPGEMHDGAGGNDGRRTVRRTLTMGADDGRIEGRVAPAGIASRAFVSKLR